LQVVMPFAAFSMDDFDVRGIEAFELKVPTPSPPRSPLD
jgi:hypothetical protein